MKHLTIELNTAQQVARLPNDKVDRCLSLVSEFLEREKVTLKELQTLCGTLNFACQVIPLADTYHNIINHSI
jgi:hypothetical protein